MVALGHKQTFALQKVMSALPPKADMCGATSDVRYGPKADIGRLTDRESILLRRCFYHPCLDAGLNLGGFSVIASRLCAQIIGGCAVAHLTRHFQT
jgi:hypothetical protein